MSEFFQALRDPDIAFFHDAFIVGILASVALGIIGTYVVTRRITYIAGAISHCVLGGIGAALYLRTVCGWAWCDPLYGAVASALLAAVLIGLVSLYARQREDSVIGALWSVGMAVGLLFFAKTPGYADPMSYLFGNILLVGREDLRLVVALDLLVAGLGIALYHKFLAVCFDEEFTELRGVRVKLHYLLLLCLTALTVVLLVRVVGIVMVIALLTLPAAVAGHFSRQLWQMMGLAILCCMAFITAGLGVSYHWDLPPGPSIIILAAGVYLAVVLIRGAGRLRGG
ncbi:MAG: metal ABC transporter permease [Thermoguttaceae bacterium]|jgi:zinc transport system permease protein